MQEELGAVTKDLASQVQKKKKAAFERLEGLLDNPDFVRFLDNRSRLLRFGDETKVGTWPGLCHCVVAALSVPHGAGKRQQQHRVLLKFVSVAHASRVPGGAVLLNRARRLVEHCVDVLQQHSPSSSACGRDYLQVLEKYILPVPHYCAVCDAHVFQDMLEVLMMHLAAESRLTEEHVPQAHALQLVLQNLPGHLDADVRDDVLAFLQRCLERLRREESARKVACTLLAALAAFLQQHMLDRPSVLQTLQPPLWSYWNWCWSQRQEKGSRWVEEALMRCGLALLRLDGWRDRGSLVLLLQLLHSRLRRFHKPSDSDWQPPLLCQLAYSCTAWATLRLWQLPESVDEDCSSCDEAATPCTAADAEAGGNRKRKAAELGSGRGGSGKRSRVPDVLVQVVDDALAGDTTRAVLAVVLEEQLGCFISLHTRVSWLRQLANRLQDHCPVQAVLQNHPGQGSSTAGALDLLHWSWILRWVQKAAAAWPVILQGPSMVPDEAQDDSVLAHPSSLCSGSMNHLQGQALWTRVWEAVVEVIKALQEQQAAPEQREVVPDGTATRRCALHHRQLLIEAQRTLVALLAAGLIPTTLHLPQLLAGFSTAGPGRPGSTSDQLVEVQLELVHASTHYQPADCGGQAPAPAAATRSRLLELVLHAVRYQPGVSPDACVNAMLAVLGLSHLPVADGVLVDMPDVASAASLLQLPLSFPLHPEAGVLTSALQVQPAALQPQTSTLQLVLQQLARDRSEHLRQQRCMAVQQHVPSSSGSGRLQPWAAILNQVLDALQAAGEALLLHPGPASGTSSKADLPDGAQARMRLRLCIVAFAVLNALCSCPAAAAAAAAVARLQQLLEGWLSCLAERWVASGSAVPAAGEQESGLRELQLLAVLLRRARQGRSRAVADNRRLAWAAGMLVEEFMRLLLESGGPAAFDVRDASGSRGLGRGGGGGDAMWGDTEAAVDHRAPAAALQQDRSLNNGVSPAACKQAALQDHLLTQLQLLAAVAPAEMADRVHELMTKLHEGQVAVAWHVRHGLLAAMCTAVLSGAADRLHDLLSWTDPGQILPPAQSNGRGPKWWSPAVLVCAQLLHTVLRSRDTLQRAGSIAYRMALAKAGDLVAMAEELGDGSKGKLAVAAPAKLRLTLAALAAAAAAAAECGVGAASDVDLEGSAAFARSFLSDPSLLIRRHAAQLLLPLQLHPLQDHAVHFPLIWEHVPANQHATVEDEEADDQACALDPLAVLESCLVCCAAAAACSSNCLAPGMVALMCKLTISACQSSPDLQSASHQLLAACLDWVATSCGFHCRRAYLAAHQRELAHAWVHGGPGGPGAVPAWADAAGSMGELQALLSTTAYGDRRVFWRSWTPALVPAVLELKDRTAAQAALQHLQRCAGGEAAFTELLYSREVFPVMQGWMLIHHMQGGTQAAVAAKAFRKVLPDVQRTKAAAPQHTAAVCLEVLQRAWHADSEQLLDACFVSKQLQLPEGAGGLVPAAAPRVSVQVVLQALAGHPSSPAAGSLLPLPLDRTAELLHGLQLHTSTLHTAAPMAVLTAVLPLHLTVLILCRPKPRPGAVPDGTSPAAAPAMAPPTLRYLLAMLTQLLRLQPLRLHASFLLVVLLRMVSSQIGDGEGGRGCKDGGRQMVLEILRPAVGPVMEHIELTAAQLRCTGDGCALPLVKDPRGCSAQGPWNVLSGPPAGNASSALEKTQGFLAEALRLLLLDMSGAAAVLRPLALESLPDQPGELRDLKSQLVQEYRSKPLQSAGPPQLSQDSPGDERLQVLDDIAAALADDITQLAADQRGMSAARRSRIRHALSRRVAAEAPDLAELCRSSRGRKGSGRRLSEATWKLLVEAGEVQDREMLALAGELLARLGLQDPDAAPPHSVNAAGGPGDAELTDGYQKVVLGRVLAVLAEALVDPDPRVVGCAHAVCRAVLATPDGQAALADLPGSSPATAHLRAFAPSPSASRDRFGDRLDLEPARRTDAAGWPWAILSDAQYDAWVVGLVHKLLQDHSARWSYRLLVPLLPYHPSVAELLLPHLLVDLALGAEDGPRGEPDDQQEASRLEISAAVAAHVLNNANSPARAVWLVLQSLNLLRSVHRTAVHAASKAASSTRGLGGRRLCAAAAWYRVYWLDLDYLDVAAAALRCGSPQSAMLFAEHWWEQAGEAEGQPMGALFSQQFFGDGGGSRDGTGEGMGRGEMVRAEQLAGEIFSAPGLPDMDAVHAVSSRPSVATQLTLHRQSGDWHCCLALADSLMLAEAAPASAAPLTHQVAVGARILQSLRQAGCRHLMAAHVASLQTALQQQRCATATPSRQAVDQMLDLRHEAAWQLAAWDDAAIPADECSLASGLDGEGPGLHGAVLGALCTLKEADSLSARQHAAAGQAQVAMSLARLGCCQNSQQMSQALVHLLMLQACSDVAALFLPPGASAPEAGTREPCSLDGFPGTVPDGPNTTLTQGAMLRGLLDRQARQIIALQGHFQDLQEPLLAVQWALVCAVCPRAAGGQLEEEAVAAARQLQPEQMARCRSSVLLEAAKASRKSGFLDYAAACLQMLPRTTLTWEDPLCASVHMEEAKMLWARGHTSMALHCLSTLVRRLDRVPDADAVHRPESLAAQLQLALALALLGKWQAARRSKPARDILATMQRAVEVVPDCPGPGHEWAHEVSRVRSRCLYRLGLYARRQYRSVLQKRRTDEWKTNAAAIAQKEAVLQGLVAEDKARQASGAIKKDRDGRRLDRQDQVRLSHITQLRRLIDLDSQQTQALQDNQDRYLSLALDSFLKCLQVGAGVYDLHLAFHVIGVWFQLPQDRGVSEQLAAHLPAIPSHKFLCLSYQIASRLTTHEPRHASETAPAFPELVRDLVLRMAKEHPYHVLWQVFALTNGAKVGPRGQPVPGPGHGGLQHSADGEKVRAAEGILEVLEHRPELTAVVQQMRRLLEAYITLARHPPPSGRESAANMTMPRAIRRSVQDLDKVVVPSLEIQVQPDGGYNDLPMFAGFEDLVEFVGGINKPKLVRVRDHQGNIHRQLVKAGSDDLRQDAVMQQFFGLVNRLLDCHRATRRRRLRIRTYEVVPFSPVAGMLAWVENTLPMCEFLFGKDRKGGAHRRYAAEGDLLHPECMQRLYRTVPGQLKKEFLAICRRFKPVMHHFFLENFRDPTEWHCCRLAYVRSTAVNSMAGYVIGLGDRHPANILLDHSSAEVVHIDLGIAFEQGRLLSTPEQVPFRLTRDVVDGMGVCGVEGTMRRCCEEVLQVMRSNQEALLTLIEVFIHDPLYKWAMTLDRARRAQRPGSAADDAPAADATVPAIAGVDGTGNADAERALVRVKAKLEGWEGSEGEPSSVEGQVQQLFQDAMSPDLLCRMYVGWQAWA